MVQQSWLMRLTAVLAIVTSLLLCWPKEVGAQSKSTLVASFATGINSLDPARFGNLPEYSYGNLVFNALAYIDKDLKLQPDLAESWQTSDDLKVWTFKLRDNVKFHDGRPLTADDVVWTVQRILDPKTGSRIRANLQIVKSVTAVDRLTVRFELNGPYADLASVLADYPARIVPNGYTDLAKHPIGTGPFKFVSFVPGDRLVAVKNENYWEKGYPKVDEVRLMHIPEMSSAITALESGSVHIVADIRPESISQIRSGKAATVQSVPSGTWMGYVMHNEKPPFNDIRVRRAFAALVDKEEVIKIASFGTGTVTHSPIPPRHPYFLNEVATPKADLATAKKLLADAGYAKGLKLKIWYPSADAEQERLALALREMAKKAGVDIELSGVPNDKFYGEVEGKESLATTMLYGRPTPDTQTYLWYHSTGSWNRNMWHYSNPKMDALLEAARAAKTEEERTAIYKDVQRTILEDVPGIVVYVKAISHGVRNNVEGFSVSPRAWLELKGVSLKN